jgi:hypothetical protein
VGEWRRRGVEEWLNETAAVVETVAVSASGNENEPGKA